MSEESRSIDCDNKLAALGNGFAGTCYTLLLGWALSVVMPALSARADSSKDALNASGCIPVNPTHKVSINEFLAANIQTNPDLDFGKFSDWIELYNRENLCVDLSGSYLTDNLNDRAKWRIPDHTLIAPGGFVLFWADARDTTGQAYHTNFKLDRDGEEIGLVDLDGTAIDSVIYPGQGSDISFGRQPDMLSNWFYFGEPTANAENRAPRYENMKLADAPEFSPKGGFYRKNQVVLLETESPGAIIRYTIDGSIPNSRSHLYTAPIPLDSTIVLRASVFEAERLPGPAVTHTYLIDELITLPVVSLATEPDNLWDDKIGIYVKGTNGIPRLPGEDIIANFFQDWERPFNIEYFDNTGICRFNLRVGVKIMGFSSRGFQQKSLSIFAREKYGKGRIEYQLFPSKNIRSFKRFILRNSGNDHDQTQFHDAVTQTLIEGRMDIDYQAYQPIIVFINGAYWGILNLREKMDDYYPEANYGIDHRDVEIVEADFGRGLPHPEHYQNLLDFILANSERRDENYQHIKTQLDVDEFINYYIFNLYIANNDWGISALNSKGWRAKNDDGRWRWMVFDTDGSFGRSDKSSYAKDSIKDRMRENIIFNLLSNSTFANEFKQRFAAHLNTTFHSRRVVHSIDSLKANIEREMPRHIERFGLPRSMEFWEEKIEVRREFARQRPRYVRQHLMDYFGITDTVRLELRVAPANSGRIEVNGVDVPNDRLTGVYFADLPVRLKAKPDPEYGFVGWNGVPSMRADSLTFVLTGDTVITASFARITTVIEPRSSDGGKPLTHSFALYQNYPNPFNSSTLIRYSLPDPALVTLEIYNLNGQKLKTVKAGNQAAGIHLARWDGRDQAGKELAAGLYLYRLKAGGFRQVKKMVLLK